MHFPVETSLLLGLVLPLQVQLFPPLQWEADCSTFQPAHQGPQLKDGEKGADGPFEES